MILKMEKNPLSFFCNLETNNFTSKIINVIEKEDGKIITDQKEILSETCNYYKTLCESKENTLEYVDLNAFMQDMEVPKLNKEEAFNLEGMVTLNETGKTRKNMKNNKSQGTSGFSADFYKVFWRLLGIFVVRAINSGFQEGEFSVTQQHGLRDNKWTSYCLTSPKRLTKSLTQDFFTSWITME